MREHNDETAESNNLQNRFTAYLISALRRKKIQILQNRAKFQRYEILLDIEDYHMLFPMESDMMTGLPLMEQLENIKLRQSLQRTNGRNLYIFLAKALEGRSLAEISAELGVGYNTVASVYYRMINKLKKELGGDKE